MNEVGRQVLAAVSEILGVPPSQLTPDTVLVDVGAESFDFMNLTFRLEQTFDVRLAGHYGDPEKYTVQTFIDAVSQQLVAKQP